jgi:hypothetical protein
MIRKLLILWLLVLVTAVPYAIYYLFFHASRSEYAFLIFFILFWIFGFWGVAGPIVSAIKIKRIFNKLQNVKSPEELKALLLSSESREAVVDLIASDNHIPKFIAKRVYNLLVQKFSDNIHHTTISNN